MPPRQRKPEAPAPVAPPSEMEKEAFCKHMTIRHNDSLAGMRELNPLHLDEYNEGLYRSFHRRLHDTRIDLEHTHSTGNPDQAWQDGH